MSRWVRFTTWLFYRTAVVDVSFDPKTGILTSSTPLPPGATLTVGMIITSDDHPVEIAQVTQREPRWWYARWATYRNGRAQKNLARRTARSPP